MLKCHGMRQVAAAALTFPAVLATRVCIGLGEGVALPSMNNMVAGLPTSKRSTALGVAFTGFHCGRQIPTLVLSLQHSQPSFIYDWQITISFPLKMCVHHPGNLIGLAISPMILAAYGWRSLFLIFGILGGPLLAFWLSVVPDPAAKSALCFPDDLPGSCPLQSRHLMRPWCLCQSC